MAKEAGKLGSGSVLQTGNASGEGEDSSKKIVHGTNCNRQMKSGKDLKESKKLDN